MQCQAITKANNQCSRPAEVGSMYCWQHQNYSAAKHVKVERKEEKKSPIKIVSPKSISSIRSPISEEEDDLEWMKSDTEYYGDIPIGTNINSLKIILANGLRNYIADAIENGSDVSKDKLEFILDLWFRHDLSKQNKINSLISDNQFDQFFDDTIELAIGQI